MPRESPFHAVKRFAILMRLVSPAGTTSGNRLLPLLGRSRKTMPSSRMLVCFCFVALAAFSGHSWSSRAETPASSHGSEADRGIVPTDDRGVPLNLDFE